MEYRDNRKKMEMGSVVKNQQPEKEKNVFFN